MDREPPVSDIVNGFSEGALMIRPSIPIAAGLAGLLLAACQAFQPAPRGTAMDGQWASTDGIFVASFDGGQFTSRFTKTNEVLAQGTYSVAGDQVSMQWLSVATQQQRSASCSFAGEGLVRCNQAGGGSFDLRRTA
jgi:hypothetical protein